MSSGSQLVTFGGFQVDISQFDFQDHSSRVITVKAWSIVFCCLVFLTVALRIFARVKYVHRVFVDDVLIVLAAVFTIALGAMSIVATNHGLGQHVWRLPLATLFDTLKSFILDLFICQVLYAFAIALTKIAIIASYLRFIPNKSFHIAMYITLFPIVGLWITGVFVTLFQCRPLQAAWNFTINRTCIDYVSYLYASSTVNVITDIALCVLPLPYFWKLDMTVKQRAILCVLLAGGASACIVGIIRIGFLHQLKVFDTTCKKPPLLANLIIQFIEASLVLLGAS
ncbi:hypothetical protein yc1106_02460 [Curvularia clavata]|uniref:Rhodopsin domain-containing protein n=1 Tax=Curvularia clavata TaxID=95742 RepID=A0A9Q9DR99_CURCL|nr:hypothetical protein yc1106_02460 [Curvularia clavata]